MSTLTDKMNECIEDPKWIDDNPVSFKVKTKTPVVAMSESGDKIEVMLAGAKEPESYDMVFNTTAMGPLQRMDIEGLVPGFGLPEDQKKILTGIRTLSYDRACKVAIKFKTRWWKGMYKNSKTHNLFGGVSSTDLSISNVVYPSWDDGDKSAVLMASYSWAQDATRMGSLIPDYSKQDPSIDDEVIKQSLQDLSKLWLKVDPTITVDFLRKQYVTHHAFAWSHDPYTGGAFALFGPGQFKYVYPEFQQLLCGGKFAICGEALSPHHAWISGALDSAYLTLLRWLKHRGDIDGIEALRKSWFGGGKGEHPAEFDEDLMYWSVEMTHGVTKQN
jgi:monoamine oxidase